MAQTSVKGLTNTANPSWIQLKVGWTVARVTAWRVHTVPTDTGGWIQTLINIYSQRNGRNYPASVWTDITRGRST